MDLCNNGTLSKVSISKLVDDIAVGKVTASDGAISCSAPTPRPSYLQALLGDHPPSERSFSRVKDEDFHELIRADFSFSNYGIDRSFYE